MELKLLDKSHTYYIYCRSGKRTIGSCYSITIKPEKYACMMLDIFLRLFILTFSLVKCYFFSTGSQVMLTPSFLKIRWSTSLSITVQ